MSNDTIAAIASGLTHAGIGIIRISGMDAVSVADKIIHMKDTKLADQLTHTIHYGFVYNKDEKLDEAVVLLMRAPHSFTAEDTVEIQCHGGPWIMKKILEAAIGAGARLAEPGEFSKRAFLNGRIDLSQAEAIKDIIQAQNTFAKDASLRQLSGSISEKVRELREELLYQLAFIESALDDPEHISLEGYNERLQQNLKAMLYQMQELLKAADNGKILAEGIHTVILGRPNVGKSSLLNQLVGEERAIVTDIAGTTRDTLEEQINLGGFTLKLIDTAGIRSTQDKVEQIGVERAKEQAKQADLLIYVVDSSESLDENDREIIEILGGHKSIVLLNKVDLNQVVDVEELERLTGQQVISISATEGTGIEELKSAIEKMFDVGEIGRNEHITITNVRHKQALNEAYESLLMLRESMEENMPEDFYTIDMMNAYQALGTIIGESVEDDLVNKIFSEFCMGK